MREEVRAVGRSRPADRSIEGIGKGLEVLGWPGLAGWVPTSGSVPGRIQGVHWLCGLLWHPLLRTKPAKHRQTPAKSCGEMRKCTQVFWSRPFDPR